MDLALTQHHYKLIVSVWELRQRIAHAPAELGWEEGGRKAFLGEGGPVGVLAQVEGGWDVAFRLHQRPHPQAVWP